MLVSNNLLIATSGGKHMADFFDSNPLLEVGIPYSPEKSANMALMVTPTRRHSGFSRIQFDQTPKHSSLQPQLQKEVFLLDSPGLNFQDFKVTMHKPLVEGSILKSSYRSFEDTFHSTSAMKSHCLLEFANEARQEESSPSHFLGSIRDHSGNRQEQLDSQENFEHESEEFVVKDCLVKAGGKKNHEKGLKNLSREILNIVEAMEFSTFKQVADKLIKRLIEEGKILNKSKDQMNIKRRTYDALNVLVSCGVLKKSGKTVSLNKAKMPSGRDQTEELRMLKAEVELKKNVLRRKHLRLFEMRGSTPPEWGLCFGEEMAALLGDIEQSLH